jgi:hypothetical protein
MEMDYCRPGFSFTKKGTPNILHRLKAFVFRLSISISDHNIRFNSHNTYLMKITHVTLLFALFGYTSARLNANGANEDQRALGNDKGNNGNGKGNGGNAISDPGDADDPSQLEERPIPGSPLPGSEFGASWPLVSDFAAGNDDDELDVLVTFKSNNGKAKAKTKVKAKKVNQELRLGNIVAITATKKVIRELALDADVE